MSEQITGYLPGSLIPAAPGQRIILVDHENEGSVALPIVAWERVLEHHEARDFPSGGHLPAYDSEYLRAWYLPNDTGIPPQPLSESTLVCGYLSPGQEWEPYWDEVANDLLKIEREEEERRVAREAKA